ncbi:MAG TPA: hypothetical protein PK156_16940 [Polyangium sp.]|nr:hypothetical protein [Polyangium sp.]
MSGTSGTSTELGFLLGIAGKEVWLFPEKVPSLTATSGSITYTMSGDSGSLLIGSNADVGAFGKAILGDAVSTAASELSAKLGDLWTNVPEPFKSAGNAIANASYYLESLRITLTRNNGSTSASFEMGVSVELNLSPPAPLDKLSLKRIYLKLKS